MDKFIGKTLNDRYILTEIVGVGGMAVVYKAFDQVVNRIVAVKILKEEYMSDAQFRRRFTNESKAITMLSQNNIVDVYDVCLEGDLMYLVMEYIDGITLKEYIDKVKVLEWHEASFYIKQILKAMSHAHERGIVHRDLKPHNIMLLRDGTIKVTDFGIAKLTKFDTHTITDKAIGSVHYISPEQASGDRTDDKTDIYSVGVMFYEMLTGTLPFIGDSAVSVALMQVQAQPKLPREINANIPEGVEEITIKAMMKDPSARYASALAMFNDIVSVEENPEITFGYLYTNVDDDLPSVDDVPTVVDESEPVSDSEQYDADDIEQPEVDPNQLDDSFNSEDNNFKSTWLPIICGVATAIIVVILVVWLIINWHELTKGKDSGGQTNTQGEVATLFIEDYVGKDYNDIISSNTLNIKFDPQPTTSDQPKNTVVRQNPVAGTEVPENSVITLYYSMGQETLSIPDLTNMSRDEAVKKLREVGIDKYSIMNITNDTVAKDYVVRTSPHGGEEATSDTTVIIYVSSGPKIVTVEVPNVIDDKEADAVKKIEGIGLKAEVEYVFDEKIEKGYVISQNPAAGENVDEGTTVVIEVSNGPKETVDEKPTDDKPLDDMIEVPDISEDTEAVAIKRIEDLGLKAEVTYENSNKIMKGYIISQGIEAGKLVTAGTTVKITVSSGAEVDEVEIEVPDVVTKAETDVVSVLEALGLKVSVEREANSEVEKGKVVSQSIAKGTKVTKGTTIKIIVSDGVAQVETPQNPPTTETPEAQS